MDLRLGRLGAACVLVVASGLASGCTALSGVGDLEEVPCVGAGCDASVDSSLDVGDTHVDDTRPDTTDTSDTNVDDTAVDSGCGDTGAGVACGACDRLCSTTNTDKVSCSGGICTSTCLPGFANCTTPAAPTPDDGCETKLDALDSCGACGKKCDTASSTGAACTGTTCTYTGCNTGFGDCDTAAPNTNGCETKLDSPDNCNGCGKKCDATGSVGATCSATGCTYASCATGFGDCTKTAPDLDGCETPLNTVLNCSACGTACDATTSSGASCTGSSCTYTACKAGYGNCDTTAPDSKGCETKLDSTANCGGCARACDTTNVLTAMCGASGVCASTCKPGFANCSTPAAPLADDGCETPFDASSCGGCGKVCDSVNSNGAACSAGTKCTYTSCKSGFADCNTTTPDTDGCETAINTITNCGACGVKCDTATSAGAACIGGKCVYTGCTTGFGNCDTTGSDANGCESPLNTPTNCTSCASTCDAAHSTGASCSGSSPGSTCTFTGCKAGFGDCTKTSPDLDGCETALNTATNCTACGLACDTLQSNGAACATGLVCSYSSCKPGFANCNTTVPDLDGCETSTLSSVTNCGGCGIHCDTGTSTGAVCVAGKCVYTGCSAGFVDCDTTGINSNGCESPTTSTTSCTGCGRVCDTTNSTGASCSTGTTCTYSGCKAGFGNCTATAPDLAGCETPLNTASNCTGCGLACDTTHSTGAACAAGTSCTYTACNGAFKNCGATAPDLDGCETDTASTATACGACGRLCSSTNVSGSTTCAGGVCTSACANGPPPTSTPHANCNKPVSPTADDGCECDGTGCCGAACQTAHSNGSPSPVGQTYYDCVAKGNPATGAGYSVTMANEAAAAWPATGTTFGSTCSATVTSNCQFKENTAHTICVAWCYSGTLAGHMYVDSTDSCFCPQLTDPTWN